MLCGAGVIFCGRQQQQWDFSPPGGIYQDYPQPTYIMGVVGVPLSGSSTSRAFIFPLQGLVHLTAAVVGPPHPCLLHHC